MKGRGKGALYVMLYYLISYLLVGVSFVWGLNFQDMRLEDIEDDMYDMGRNGMEDGIGIRIRIERVCELLGGECWKEGYVWF